LNSMLRQQNKLGHEFAFYLSFQIDIPTLRGSVNVHLFVFEMLSVWC